MLLAVGEERLEARLLRVVRRFGRCVFRPQDLDPEGQVLLGALLRVLEELPLGLTTTSSAFQPRVRGRVRRHAFVPQPRVSRAASVAKPSSYSPLMSRFLSSAPVMPEWNSSCSTVKPACAANALTTAFAAMPSSYSRLTSSWTVIPACAAHTHTPQA